MEKKAILLDEKDNVATCTSEAKPEDMVICHGGGSAKVRAVETIPIWHKIALRPIAKGGMVYKYGEIIGETLQDICRIFRRAAGYRMRISAAFPGITPVSM